MDSLSTLFLLMFAATLLVGIAQKLHIPYPIALVLGGTAIGFIPLQAYTVDPHLILIIVLPPILYYAAFGISFREFKRNWKQIFSLALGLVVVTTLVVGVIFKWLFPEFPWVLAFAFGAIVSPPDAIAATTILKRFSISSHLITVLEGESLVNDASALVLYRLTVTALLSGVFSLWDASVEFVTIVSGGVILGFILGTILQRFSRRYLEPVVGVVFSFTIPYITYILANMIHVSGVLAVVVCGLVGSQILLAHHSSLRRILGYATWDIFIILLNCFVFILIGLHLRSITSMMTIKQMALYSGYGLIITCVMITCRMLWVFYLTAHTVRDAALIGWSGMRGIVSLACALGLPYTLVGRNEVIFITFVVILLSLLIPGFTLASVVHWLKVHSQPQHLDAQRIRKQLTKVAEQKIKAEHALQHINDEQLEFLQSYFNLQRRILSISKSPHKKSQDLESIRLAVIQEQRKKLLEMWHQLEVDDHLLTILEHELDIEEIHIARAELK